MEGFVCVADVTGAGLEIARRIVQCGRRVLGLGRVGLEQLILAVDLAVTVRIEDGDDESIGRRRGLVAIDVVGEVDSFRLAGKGDPVSVVVALIGVEASPSSSQPLSAGSSPSQ